MIETHVDEKRKERWYFGGLASCLVTLIVHPLDTIKVQLQTHQGKNIGLFTVGKSIVRTAGKIYARIENCKIPGFLKFYIHDPIYDLKFFP